MKKEEFRIPKFRVGDLVEMYDNIYTVIGVDSRQFIPHSPHTGKVNYVCDYIKNEVYYNILDKEKNEINFCEESHLKKVKLLYIESCKCCNCPYKK